jgi:hypothetical protein
VDANAISPARAAEVNAFQPVFVDGGIVGGPPRERGDTRLYLSGPRAADGRPEGFHRAAAEVYRG